MEEKDIKRTFEVYKAPFTYDKDGQWVVDFHEKMICDIRGWGFLQNHADGDKIQDNVGKLIVSLLNQKYEQIKIKSPK